MAKRNAKWQRTVFSLLLLLLIVGLSLLPAWIFTQRLGTEEDQSVRNSIDTINERNAYVVLNFLEENLTNMRILSDTISELCAADCFDDGDTLADSESSVFAIGGSELAPASAAAAAMEGYWHNKELDALVLAGANGWYSLKSDNVADDFVESLLTVSKQRVFNDAVLGNSKISQMSLTDNGARAVVSVIPVISEDNVVAVLYGAYLEQTLISVLTPSLMKIETSPALILVVNKEGDCIANCAENHSAAIMQSTDIRRAAEQREVFSVSLNGKKYLASAQTIKADYFEDGAGLSVVSAMPEEILAKDFQNNINMATLAMGLITGGLGLCFIIIVYIANQSRSRSAKDVMKYRAAMEVFKKCTFEYDLLTGFVYFSNVAKDVLELEKDKFKPSELVEMGYFSAEELSKMKEKLLSTDDNGDFMMDVYSDKTAKHLQVFINKVKVKQLRSSVVMGIIEDVTAFYEDKKSLEHKVQRDGLTDLLNRNAFIIKVDEIIAANKNGRHALYIVDIDDFKQINDKYGHYVGDVLLQKMAKTISAAVNPETMLVGRLGGDEFCIFAQNIPASSGVGNIARLISNRISAITIAEDIDYFVSCSIGVSVYPKHGITFIEMYQCADNALYKSKSKVGSYYTIYDSIESSAKAVSESGLVREARTMEDNFSLMLFSEGEDGQNKLKEILQEAMKRHEFVIYGQPKLSTVNLNDIEVEMLTRWQSPLYGRIMPNKFIPLLEKTRMMENFDFYVLEEAMRELVGMRERQENVVPVSINQSLSTITVPYYINKIKSMLKEYDVDSKMITIEITERSLFTSVRTITKVIKGLQALGFRVSIDDFGSGFTSLSILKDLKIEEIKIDKSFLDSDEGNAKSSHIVLKQICEMAKELEISTVAEGVETYEQAKFLTEVGCGYLQGFYFSKAIPMDEFNHKVRSGFFRDKRREFKNKCMSE